MGQTIKSHHMPMNVIDIGRLPEVIDAVNAIINNGKVAEIKKEQNGTAVTVVEQQRALKRKITIKEN